MSKTPLQLAGISKPLYAGFWIRFGSLLLDFLIILPVTFILYYINNRALGNYMLTIVPSLLFGLWYNVYLVQKYGGTPGKLIAGIKIIDLNGRILYSWTTTSMVEQVNISDLTSGVYLVEISQLGAHTVIRLAVD